MLDESIVTRMKNGSLPHAVCMGMDGQTVGMCILCDVNTYWCGSHYKDHTMHAFHDNSPATQSMYASNDVLHGWTLPVPPPLRPLEPPSLPSLYSPEQTLQPVLSVPPNSPADGLDYLDLNLDLDLGNLYSVL